MNYVCKLILSSVRRDRACATLDLFYESFRERETETDRQNRDFPVLSSYMYMMI